MSKGQRLAQLLRDQQPNHDSFRSIRQGLLEGTVLQAQSFPCPLCLHNECALKPSNTVDSAIASQKVLSKHHIYFALEGEAKDFLVETIVFDHLSMGLLHPTSLHCAGLQA